MATTTLLSPSCIIILLLFLSLFPFIINGSKEKEKEKEKHMHTQELIHKTCRNISAKTDSNINYAFCTSALQARPARQCATLRRIGWTCITLIMNNVTDTRRHIRALVEGGKVKRWLRRCVNECYEHYVNAASYVGDGLRYYKHKKYIDANFRFSAVMTETSWCEDLFMVGSRDTPVGGCGGGFSPFSARNNATIQLSAMAISVTHLIQEGKVLH